MNRTDNYLRNTIWGFESKIVSILLPFILRTVLIYSLDITYVGLNTLFSTILQVLSLAELGFGSAMIYSMYRPISLNDNIGICALLNLYRSIYRIIGIIVLLAGLTLMPFLSKFINGAYPDDINIYILYLIYLLNTVSSYLLFAYRSSLLNAYQRNDIKNKINMIVNSSLYTIQIIVLLTLHNYYVYIILLPIATIVNNIIIAKKSIKMYPDIVCNGEVDKETKDRIKKQVVSLMWHKVGNTIIFSFDSIVISQALGLRVLGIYNNYFYIYNSAASLFSIFYESIIPGIGNSLIVESKEKNLRDFKDFSCINFMMTSFCASCLLCLYQPFMQVWQGEKLMYENRIPILLSVLFVIWHSRRMIHTYKDASGLWIIDKYRPISEASVNLVLNIVMVRLMGLQGVVLSTILAMLVLGMPWETKKFVRDFLKMDLISYFIFVIKNLVKILVVCLMTWKLSCLIPDGNMSLFIAKAFICAIVTGVLTHLLYYKEDGYKRVVNIMKGKVLKRRL